MKQQIYKTILLDLEDIWEHIFIQGFPLNNNSILPSGLLGNLLGPLGTSFICITGIVLSLSLYFSSSISFLKSVLGFLSRKITQEKKTEESVIEKDPVVQKKSKPQKNESKPGLS